jgi:protein-S-isoprenylcysteine O-methyltransferase Ste14
MVVPLRALHNCNPEEDFRSCSLEAHTEASNVKRIITFLYGAVSYAICLATFLYAIGFIGNFAVPKPMDSALVGLWPTALLIDLGLLSLFALQHSIMARPVFKRVLTRVVPESAERSTYVLASCVALLFLFWQWRPLGGTVWEVQNEFGKTLLYCGYAFGWALVLLATVVINHFDLFGLRQVWRHLQGKPQSNLEFATPLLYRIVRHPLYVGWLVVFWSTPAMTVTHLVFAVVATAYIMVAIQFEERDLRAKHPEYAAYRQQVPMIVPGMPRHLDISPSAGVKPATFDMTPLAGRPKLGR